MNISIKKILQFFGMICFLVSFSITFAHAKSGDVIGKVYSSDILAVVNGCQIESYNIGGKTVISADELKDYGFSVWYDDKARQLFVATSYYDGIAEKALNANVPRGKVGSITGMLYETNIETFVNGLETASYAVDGKICVSIEDLGDLTDSANAEYGYSKYYMKCGWDAEKRIVSLNALFNNSGDFFNSKVCKNGYGITITAPKNVSEGFVEFEGGYFDVTVSSSSLYPADKIIPLRLRCEEENTDFVVGYTFSYYNSNGFSTPQFHFFFDVLEQAFDEGYYHVVTHDERIQYINSHFIISRDQPYERFDTDICTVIYFEQHGLPHGHSNYNLVFIYMDGSFVQITRLPLKDIALSDDGTKLLYVSIMNGKTYEVDLATAEVNEKKYGIK